MRPAVGFRKPLMMLNSVVLPAPFGPIRPVMLCSATERLHLLTAVTPPNDFVTPSASRMLGALPFSMNLPRIVTATVTSRPPAHSFDHPRWRCDTNPNVRRCPRRHLQHLLRRQPYRCSRTRSSDHDGGSRGRAPRFL